MEALIFRPKTHILRCKVRIFPPTDLAYAYDANFSIGVFPNENEREKWERAFMRCLKQNDMTLVSSLVEPVWPTAHTDVDFDQAEEDGLPWEVVPVLPQLVLKRCFERAWSRHAHAQ